MDPDRARTRRYLLGWSLGWLLAAVVAVAVGLFAVTSVGATLRGRGPIGADAAEFVQRADQVEGDAVPDPDDPQVTEQFPGAYGTFTVVCQGPFAATVDLSPARGWRVVSVEPGPDDDVDAILSASDRSVELEVFCDQGRPALGDREVKTLPEPSAAATGAP